MAALRIFARSAIPTIRSPLLTTGHSWKNTFPIVYQTQQKCISIKVGVGPKEQEIELPDFEITKDPKEWSFVEMAMHQKIIPRAPVEDKVYPSGWKPQSYATKSLPYFIERTKNHMIPVYLIIGQRGLRKRTHIRRIQGDIMLLEKEIKEYLEKQTNKRMGTQVNEPAGVIKVRGDYVNLCLNFLKDKGF